MARPAGVRRAARWPALLPAMGMLLAMAGCGDSPVAQALLGGPVAPAGPASGAQPGAPVLRVDGGRRPFVFTLLQDSGGRQLWRAEGGAALATDGARITATAGLGAGLAATRFEGADPLDDPRALLGQTVRSRRSLDLQGASQDPADLRFGVQVSCEAGATPDGAWLLMQEDCSGDDLAFTNRFWADPATGAIRRSEQWGGAGMLTVEGP